MWVRLCILGAVLMAANGIFHNEAIAQDDNFTLSLDTPLVFNFDDGGEASGVSGYLLSLAFPFNIGIGYEDYTIEEEDIDLGETLLINVQMTNIFIYIPLDSLNFTLGYGEGSASFDPKSFVTAVGTLDLEDAELDQYLLRAGFKLSETWDVHVGYQVLSGGAEILNSGVKVGETNLDGNLYTAGLAYAF